MRWRRYIVFLVVFLISLGIASSLNRWHTNKIREMVNYAGKNGLPIFVTFTSTWFESYLAVTAPGFNLVPLSLNPKPNSGESGFFPDGTFFTTQYRFSSHKTVMEYFKFPKRYPVSQLDTLSTWLAGSYPNFGNAGLSAGRYSINSQNLNHIFLMDHAAMEITEVNVGADAPWLLDISPAGKTWSFWVSPDSHIIFAAGFDKLNPGPVEVWRYDIAAKALSSIGTHEIFEGGGITVGPDGNLIAYYKPVPTSASSAAPNASSYSPKPNVMDLEFADGHTGEIIKTVITAKYPQIGSKWVSCLIPSSTGSSSWGWQISLFDTQNGWTNQILSTSPYFLMNKMYEPPPNGLAGMYENYVE